MALTKETVIDKIEITEDGSVQVRRATYIVENGVRIAGPNYHRSAYVPGADIATEGARVRAVAGKRDDLVEAALDGRITGSTRFGTELLPTKKALDSSRSLTPDAYRNAEQAASILAQRTRPGFDLTEAGALAGGLGWLVNPTVGGAAALSRLAFKHFPAQSAIATNALGNLLESPVTSAALSSGAALNDESLEASIRQMLDEQMKRR